MADFKVLLYQRIKQCIDSFDTKNVYALYFGVTTNPADNNMPHFCVGRGVEGVYLTEKWHLAVNAEDETEITADDELNAAMTNWLHSQGIENIGAEDSEQMYDEMMIYIGKGPAGKYELMQLGVTIAKRLFDEGFIREKFGREIPVIFDGLETVWYHLEATEKANPAGLASEFLHKYRYNRKNSGTVRRLVKVMMSVSTVFGIIMIFPLTFFSAAVTLVFGGIALPLTTGGVIKCVAAVLALIKRIKSVSHIIKSLENSEGEKAVPKLIFLGLADIAAAAFVLFSVNYIADRATAVVFLATALIYCVVHNLRQSAVRKKLTEENGSEISKQFEQIRRQTQEKRDNNGNNDETDKNI